MITVKTCPRTISLGPANVVVAGMECGLGARNRSQAKDRLANVMCRHSGIGEPVEIEYSRLGQPFLKIGPFSGPFVSFSYVRDALWGALCIEGPVGMDVSPAEDFTSDYPFSRVFHPNEFDYVKEKEDNEKAALLWSIKEAAVKLLGCGFHFLDPLDVHAQVLTTSDEASVSRVLFSLRVMEKLEAKIRPAVLLKSFRHECGWATVAVGAVQAPLPLPRQRLFSDLQGD